MGKKNIYRNNKINYSRGEKKQTRCHEYEKTVQTFNRKCHGLTLYIILNKKKTEENTK